MNPVLKWMGFAILATGALALSLLFCGCAGTVHPSTVQAAAPSYTGNATSGIVEMETGGSYVTAEWVANYNQGVIDYGADPFFKHRLVKNEGITTEEDGGYFANDEAHFNYGMFQSWRRSKTHQPKTLLQKAGVP